MGILCMVLSVVFGFVGVVSIMAASAISAQIFGGEMLICFCVLFAAGAVCNAVDKATARLPTPESKPGPDVIA
jgi:hypothetical protein